MRSPSENTACPISENTVASGIQLWSVMIPTYNCASYLEKTLQSVLGGDLGSELMQIEVVDDHSTKDDPHEVVRDIGKGRVQFFRQPKNVGLAKNFNTCIKRSTGKLVHILHGDDLVSPKFYSRLSSVYEKHESSCGLFATKAILIDSNGNETGVSTMVKELETPTRIANSMLQSNDLRTPAIVVSRNAYEKLGGFREDLSHVADWEMWVRIITSVGGIMIDEPLAYYRVSENNDTNKVERSGDNLRDYLRASKYFELHSNHFKRDSFTRNIQRMMLEQAIRFKNKNDVLAAQNNLDSWVAEVGILRSLNQIRRLDYKTASGILPIWIKSAFRFLKYNES